MGSLHVLMRHIACKVVADLLSRRRVISLLDDQGGASAILFAVVLTGLCGIVGLSMDLGMWYRTTRAMQNASDAAAIAAARDGTSSYQSTGKAVAAKYGFVDGVGGISVTLVNNQTCPDGQTNCYLATVTEPSADRYFVGVLGVPAPTLSSSAMVDGAAIHDYCLVGLGTSGTSPAVQSHGAPKSDLNGCSAYSGTAMSCTGSNLNADSGDAVGTNSGCGNVQNSGVAPIKDTFAALASNIPLSWVTSCGGTYNLEPTKKNPTPLPASNVWSTSTVTLGAVPTIICGDLQLQGAPGTIVQVTTASPGSVLVIENGQLDLNGLTLQTPSGSGLTIIFSGTNGGSWLHGPTSGAGNGTGTLDYAAPTSGTWSGVAMYEDPALKTGIDLTNAGNTPTWDITGLVYLPHASVTLSGIVNKASNGASCFSLVTDNVQFNGTGAIIPRGGCAAAGLTMPSDTVNGAYVLVK